MVFENLTRFKYSNFGFAFSPLAESPMKEMTLLLPKGKDEFLIENEGPFAYVGETAKFVFKNGRKPQLIWGANPLELQTI